MGMVQAVSLLRGEFHVSSGGFSLRVVDLLQWMVVSRGEAQWVLAVTFTVVVRQFSLQDLRVEWFRISLWEVVVTTIRARSESITMEDLSSFFCSKALHVESENKSSSSSDLIVAYTITKDQSSNKFPHQSSFEGFDLNIINEALLTKKANTFIKDKSIKTPLYKVEQWNLGSTRIRCVALVWGSDPNKVWFGAPKTQTPSFSSERYRENKDTHLVAFLFQKFQEAVRILAKSPTFARNPRHIQFEADINRLLLYTSYNRLGRNADESDAEAIIDMAGKAFLADQQKQVQENIHSQIKTFCASMDEILLPDSKSINESSEST
ncbi:hypothetical protein ACSBR2_035379 [Camellia fascicularis]